VSGQHVVVRTIDRAGPDTIAGLAAAGSARRCTRRLAAAASLEPTLRPIQHGRRVEMAGDETHSSTQRRNSATDDATPMLGDWGN
jgi:hypothetical protein